MARNFTRFRPRGLYRAPSYLTSRPFLGPYPLGSAQRVLRGNTNPLSLALGAYLTRGLLAPKDYSYINSSPVLSEYEDRRRWHPAPVAPPLALRATRSAVGELPPYVPWIERPARVFKIDWKTRRRVDVTPRLDPWSLGFENWQKVVICLKRKMRREVINAMGLNGKVGQSKKTLNPFSRVRC